MTSLDITTTRDLEDLCINTIYASLLTGKLSPHTQTFQITSCTSRDLSPTHTDYPGMISTLTQWSAQCDLVLAEIAGRIRDVRTSAAARKIADDDFEKDLEAAKKSSQAGPAGATGTGAGGGGGKKGKSKSALSGGGGGPMSQQAVDDVNAELMQDVEEQQDVVSVGRASVSSAATGGESPSGRKRKLVRPPDFFVWELIYCPLGVELSGETLDWKRRGCKGKLGSCRSITYRRERGTRGADFTFLLLAFWSCNSFSETDKGSRETSA